MKTRLTPTTDRHLQTLVRIAQLMAEDNLRAAADYLAARRVPLELARRALLRRPA